MADWSKILTSEVYATLLASIKGMIYDVARGLDPAVVTLENAPVDAIRWSMANKRWEKFDGSTWPALASVYSIDISGNASTVSNGLYTGDIGSKVPSPTGSGASGTWNIAAATANALNASNDYSARSLTTSGTVCGTSPNNSTTGALRLRDAPGDPDAVYLQATNNARTVQYGHIKFNKDGTISPSGPITNVFPTGTHLLFAQASAPTGWTQVTDDAADNRLLRVVNSAGGGVGGLHSPILNNVVPSHGHNFTTSTESSYHTHASVVVSGYSVAAGSGLVNGVTYGNTGNQADQLHTHTGSTQANEGGANWTPRYLNLILCKKD